MKRAKLWLYLKEDRGMSAAFLAKKVGTNANYLSDIMHGRKHLSDIHDLATKIEGVLGLTRAELQDLLPLPIKERASSAEVPQSECVDVAPATMPEVFSPEPQGALPDEEEGMGVEEIYLQPYQEELLGSGDKDSEQSGVVL